MLVLVINLCTDAFAKPGIVSVCISGSADPISRTVFHSVGFFFLPCRSLKEMVLVRAEEKWWSLENYFPLTLFLTELSLGSFRDH